MKLPIKEIVLLGVYGVILVFIIGAVLYYDFSGENGMLHAAGDVYEANTEQQTISRNGDRISVVTAAAATEIRYVNRTFRAGEEFQVRELFEVKTAGADDFVSAVNEDGFSLSVQDIRDEAGNSFLSGAQEDEETSEELAAVTFQRSTGKICFNRSGIYKLRVLVWGENGRSVLGEVALPVETGGTE